MFVDLLGGAWNRHFALRIDYFPFTTRNNSCFLLCLDCVAITEYLRRWLSSPKDSWWISVCIFLISFESLRADNMFVDLLGGAWNRHFAIRLDYFPITRCPGWWLSFPNHPCWIRIWAFLNVKIDISSDTLRSDNIVLDLIDTRNNRSFTLLFECIAIIRCSGRRLSSPGHSWWSSTWHYTVSFEAMRSGDIGVDLVGGACDNISFTLSLGCIAITICLGRWLSFPNPSWWMSVWIHLTSYNALRTSDIVLDLVGACDHSRFLLYLNHITNIGYSGGWLSLCPWWITVQTFLRIRICIGSDSICDDLVSTRDNCSFLLCLH